MKQSNGTIMVYSIRDMVHGRMHHVSIKGVDGGNRYTYGRGQYKITAKPYVQAQQMAKHAGLGSYPILEYPFNGLPDLGRIE